MIDRGDITQKYLRSKLSKFTKDEIIDCILNNYDYTFIDLLSARLGNARSIKQAQEEEKRLDENLKKTEKAINEYNGLVKKANEVGFQKMSLKEVQRMNELLKIIRSTNCACSYRATIDRVFRY